MLEYNATFATSNETKKEMEAEIIIQNSEREAFEEALTSMEVEVTKVTRQKNSSVMTLKYEEPADLFFLGRFFELNNINRRKA